MAYKPIYQRLREYRESQGQSQAFIARRAGIRPNRISAIETGKNRLTADEFESLAIRAYKVEPADILARLQEPARDYSFLGENAARQTPEE